jgi:hypothetical protein
VPKRPELVPRSIYDVIRFLELYAFALSSENKLPQPFQVQHLVTLQEVAALFSYAVRKGLMRDLPVSTEPIGSGAIDLFDFEKWVVGVAIVCAHTRRETDPPPLDAADRFAWALRTVAKYLWTAMGRRIRTTRRLRRGSVAAKPKVASTVRQTRPDAEEAVANYIRRALDAGRQAHDLTRDGISTATGVSAGAVSNTDAWKRLRGIKGAGPVADDASRGTVSSNIQDAIDRGDWDEVAKHQATEERHRRVRRPPS